MKAMELLSKIDQLQIKHKGLRNENAIKLINQFKKEVCKKQRKICADVRNEGCKYFKSGVYIYCEDILNAPEPE